MSDEKDPQDAFENEELIEAIVRIGERLKARVHLPENQALIAPVIKLITQDGARDVGKLLAALGVTAAGLPSMTDDPRTNRELLIAVTSCIHRAAASLHNAMRAGLAQSLLEDLEGPDAAAAAQLFVEHMQRNTASWADMGA